MAEYDYVRLTDADGDECIFSRSYFTVDYLQWNSEKKTTWVSLENGHHHEVIQRPQEILDEIKRAHGN